MIYSIYDLPFFILRLIIIFEKATASTLHASRKLRSCHSMKHDSTVERIRIGC